jgi:hypothetical protein
MITVACIFLALSVMCFLAMAYLAWRAPYMDDGPCCHEADGMFVLVRDTDVVGVVTLTTLHVDEVA